MVQAAIKNPEYFQELYDKYFEVIFRFVHRRVEEEQLAADITADTFYEALKNLKKYTFRGLPFSAWLYRIASNEVNSFYRKSRRQLVYSLEPELISNLADQELADGQMANVDNLLHHMRRLPAIDIEVLELRFFEEKSFAELAFILDLTEATVKMRTYRAIEKLRKAMVGQK